jgi:hypothetical protein
MSEQQTNINLQQQKTWKISIILAYISILYIMFDIIYFFSNNLLYFYFLQSTNLYHNTDRKLFNWLFFTNFLILVIFLFNFCLYFLKLKKIEFNYYINGFILLFISIIQLFLSFKQKINLATIDSFLLYKTLFVGLAGSIYSIIYIIAFNYNKVKKRYEKIAPYHKVIGTQETILQLLKCLINL